jgi:hypothetical protein
MDFWEFFQQSLFLVVINQEMSHQLTIDFPPMSSIDIVDIVLTQKDSGLDFFERFWEDPPQALDKKSSEFSDRGIVDGTLDMNAMNML